MRREVALRRDKWRKKFYRGLSDIGKEVMHIMEQSHRMSFLDESGDVEIKWNPDSPWEVHEAKKQFDRLVKEKGYRGFRIEKDGQKTLMHEFDPYARRIVMAPASKVAVAGG